ncbi:MAG TPA: hypothetical protein VN717_02255 [Gemmatimonadaceae bacterium]|nr:hypothetical protein [Gemmatimonadaceae bacterium]
MGDIVSVDGLEYRSIVDSDFTAFYDRIQNYSGLLLGFEIGVLIDEITIRAALSSLPYARLGRASHTIQVFLRRLPSNECVVQDDQAFGGRIYESVTGVIAVSINMDWLTDVERNAIETSDADWVTST